MFNVIIFGPPGSGKGTQSGRIVIEYQLKHISTGDLLRSEIAAGSPLGLQAKKIMDRGELVSDEVILGMIRDVFDKNANCNGFLFDGFPRTRAQALELDSILADKGAAVDVVFALDVSEEELVSRLLKRGQTSGRSDDVSKDVIRARIGEYNRKTSVVLNHYAADDKVIHIKGEGSIEQIFDHIAAELNKVKQEQGE